MSDYGDMGEVQVSDESYSLKASTVLIGRVVPVLKTRKGEIIDGYHRKGEDPSWPEIEVVDINTPLQIAFARLIVNTNRRTVSSEEKQSRLSEIFEEWKKEQGDYPTIEEIARLLGRSKTWVYDYLPQRFKDKQQVKAGKARAEQVKVVRATDSGTETLKEEAIKQQEVQKEELKTAEITEPKTLADLIRKMVALRDDRLIYRLHYRNALWAKCANYVRTCTLLDEGAQLEDILKSAEGIYAPRISEKAGSKTPSQYTAAQITFGNALAKLGLQVEFEQEFLREGEFNREGKHKSYVVDILVNRTIAVELEGEGSSSKDDNIRDQFLKAKGLAVIHLPNELALQNLEHEANCIKMLADGKKRQNGGPEIKGRQHWTEFVRTLDGAQVSDLLHAVREERYKDVKSCPLCGTDLKEQIA